MLQSKKASELSSKSPNLFLIWLCIIADLLAGLFILTCPALFSELIYPLLSPYGILLAINLLGWWHLGRGFSLLFAPQTLRLILTTWLWLASIPYHLSSLLLYSISWSSYVWHGSNIILIMSLCWSFSKRQKNLS